MVELMQHIPYPGQKLKITNSDYIVLSEEWVVVAVEYPIVTFSCTKWWDYNAITMQGKTVETVIGEIVETNDKEAIVAFLHCSGTAEVGLAIQGDQATYLSQLNSPKHT